MKNQKIKLINREELKPYADSEKLGYLIIHGFIEEGKKLAPKGKILVRNVSIFQFRLNWMNKDTMPKVVTESIGYLDHCFLDEQMRHCVSKTQVMSNVKVVPYQRLDGSTSYTFEAPTVVEKLLGDVLILIRLLTDKSINHSRETTMSLIRGLQDDLTMLVDIKTKSIKPKGLESLAVANINDEIINAGIVVVKNILYKIAPEKKQKKKKRKSFATL